MIIKTLKVLSQQLSSLASLLNVIFWLSVTLFVLTGNLAIGCNQGYFSKAITCTASLFIPQ